MALRIYRIATAVMLIACMGMIFYFSSQNAEQSTNTSSVVIEKVATRVYPDFKELPKEKQQEKVDSLQFIVRKTAHFSIYALLGVLAFLAVISYRKIGFYTRTAVAAAVSLAYAFSDELHQMFVSGRSNELRDVLIDFCGALLGIVICTLISSLSKRLYNALKRVS